MNLVLLISVFVIATCGLIYELVSATLASYLLGDSVTQFSTVIGVYLFSMGIGSFLSRYIHRHFIALFIQVEILIGLVGGYSAALLFLLFGHVASFRILLYLMVLVIGTLVGLEIPLLMRILKDRLEFKELVARVFTFDYIGALIASILFPLLLVPRLGLVRTSLFFGILNVLVALWAVHLFGAQVVRVRLLKVLSILVLIGLALGFAYAERLTDFAETSLYADRIIYAKTSPYQRIVLTQASHASGDELRLFLNGNLQFSSRDEYRYHEALVHVGLQARPQARSVLVLGGGDGMAVREILKYENVETVTLVDLDQKMTRLFSENHLLMKLNGASLKSPKVRILNQDAFIWLRENQETFDFIVIDFPDPTNFSLGKLYTTSFFQEIRRALNPGGAVAVQSTSPLFARKSFWCVEATLRSVGFQTLPYHVYVPSFGEWGFVLASASGAPLETPTHFQPSLRFLTPETLAGMLHFPKDMERVETEVNRLNNQILVRYYEEEWSEYVDGSDS